MINRRSRGALVALGLSALAVTVAPSIASAASVGEAYNHSLSSGSESLGGYHIGGYDSLGLASFDVDVAAKATWTSPLQTVVGWDTAKVRQGADLSVGRSVSPLALGTLKVRWTLTGSVKPKGFSSVDIGTKAIGDDATCSLQTIGGGYSCVAISNGVPLVKTPGIPASPYVKVALKATFNITAEGVITNRSFSVDGANAGTASNLPLSVLPTAETIKVPCGPVGSSVAYRLSSLRWTPAVAVTQQPTVQIGLMDPVLGLAEGPSLYDHAFGPAIHSNPTFELTATGHTTDLGDLLANNVAPTIAPLGGFSGKAGVPVAFSADADGRCDIESYVWKFSNGTTSYGAAPSRTFAAAGSYDGELTVTDASGLKTTRSFTVTITK
jgi:hypothetical protein